VRRKYGETKQQPIVNEKVRNFLKRQQARVRKSIVNKLQKEREKASDQKHREREQMYQ